MSDEQFRTALGRTEERWNAQLDRLFDRFEKSVDRLEAKFDQRMDVSERNVQSEFTEAKLAAGELRDGIALLRERVDSLEDNREGNMRAAAQGAATGAGEAAGRVATAAAAVAASSRPKTFLETFWGKAVVVCTGFTALIAALGVVPNVLRGVGLFWAFITGMAK